MSQRSSRTGKGLVIALAVVEALLLGVVILRARG